MNGVNDSWIRKEMSLLKNLFNFAIEYELTTNNPFISYNFASKLKKYEPRERYLTPEECQQLIQAIIILKNSSLERMIIFMLESGLRVNEAIQILYSDISTDPQTNIKFLNIRKEISKSKRNRFVPLTKLAMEQVNKQFRDFSSCPFIFTNSSGCKYDKEPRKAFNNAKNKANLNDIGGFHTLRHTFASLKLQGLSIYGEKIKPLRIEIIAEILGHTDINLTKKVYAKFCKQTLINEFFALENQ